MLRKAVQSLALTKPQRASPWLALNGRCGRDFELAAKHEGGTPGAQQHSANSSSSFPKEPQDGRLVDSIRNFSFHVGAVTSGSCHWNSPSPFFCCRAAHLAHLFSTQQHDSAEGPLPIDYSALLDEREFHKLADELLHYLQEKFDELGEESNLDGFDIDYVEGVLTIKLGASSTYVINKQTPNRQIWLSSPVSGPARFDWDMKEQHWVYRRTKAEIFQLLEKEVHDLVGASIALSK